MSEDTPLTPEMMTYYHQRTERHIHAVTIYGLALASGFA